jgi:hypothetical protein
MKLEATDAHISTFHGEGGEHSRDVQQADNDDRSMFQIEVPPWAEQYEISATGMNDKMF